MKKHFLKFTNRRFAHVGGTTPEEAAAALRAQTEKDKEADALKKKQEDGESNGDDEKDGVGGGTPPAIATPEPETPQPEKTDESGDGTHPEPEVPATEEQTGKTIPFDPEMSDESIEEHAQQLAGMPNQLAAGKRMLARAEEIVAERNKPQPLNDEDKALAVHQEKLKLHGPDYVDAFRTINKQKQFRTFSRQTWVTLGSNKSGWEEIKKEMPEAKAAQPKEVAPATGEPKKTPARPNRQGAKPTQKPPVK